MSLATIKINFQHDKLLKLKSDDDFEWILKKLVTAGYDLMLRYRVGSRFKLSFIEHFFMSPLITPQRMECVMKLIKIELP